MKRLAFICCMLVLTIATLNIHPPALAQNTTPLKNIKIDFKLVGEHFDDPVAIANASDDSGRLFVVEKPGRIMILKDGFREETPFLDIVSLVNSESYERGLLGLAFHPKYKDNGYFY